MPPIITDGQTFVEPSGMAFTMLMGVLLLVLPRRFAILPILAVICYMTMGMRVIVGGLNFTMIRILLMFGWSRLLLRGEFRGLLVNQIDKALLWYTIVSVLAYGILWNGEYEAVKYKFGQAYDCLGFYFLFRLLIRSQDEAMQVVRAAAMLCIPLAVEMLAERITLENRFAEFGGVASAVSMRDGVPRCQGPFSHPILAGTFGAALIPWFTGLLSQRGSRVVAMLGICSAAMITFTAGSSGPVMACLSGVGALCLWPLRRHMRGLRWTISGLLIALHTVMQAPVWFLIGRASVYNASTGYHRSFLIDRAIANFSGWWLVGTQSTAEWGWWLFDVTNHYIVVGTNGGVLSLALFITIMVRCFRGVGRLVRLEQDKSQEGLPLFAWAMGSTMVVHGISFISVSYFDQNLVMWYLLLAMISSLCSVFLGKQLQIQKSVALTRNLRPRARWWIELSCRPNLTQHCG